MMETKGKHVHTCPVCEEEFYGRLNRIYCSTECKSRFNNEKARVENKPIKLEYDLIRRCRKVLMILFDKYEKDKFPYNELIISGFDIEVPTRTIEFPNINEQWHRICEYAIFYHTNTKMVQLIKLDENEI